MSDTDIAIVGMATHLPGSRNIDEYWSTLRDGVECVRSLNEDELIEAGVAPATLRRPGYVPVAATMHDVYGFDSEFFGFSPKESAILDPQHRHFLMTAWEALEDAGHPPETIDGAVGVFAGCGMGSYLMFNLLSNPELVHDVGMFLLRHTGNDKDFLATRLSYLLDLHGPSVNVQTACSTSLVATHLAVQHLLSGECDVALAGGVTIEIPHGHGYQYQEGEILSPDGHCRAFDHRSEGTVFGSGSGVVVLRRLDDAVADQDHIYAVIKGTAVNNDGGRKVGYLAPSVDGQAACVAEALAVADVGADSLSYVECHGTGTPVGDPIEIAALSQAFNASSDKTGYCRIGSVKTNIGHLDTAAGVAGLAKVALSMQHREMPPTLNFESPNPALEIETSPFVVNDELTEWRREGDVPRRAGLNSLGVGGTNAFVVLEEAPDREPSTPSDAWQLITVSGRNRAALDDNAARIARHLREHPELDLADVAWTLRVGRRQFAERRVLAARDLTTAAELLESNDRTRVHSHTVTPGDKRIAFMFPGGGTQYPAMAAGLYASDPVFAQHVDEGLQMLSDQHGLELRDLLFTETTESSDERLAEMTHQLPLIFIVEYSLAKLLHHRGIEPTALVGHSLGENTAACVAGTLSFADTLGLVVLRGQLMDRVSGGAVSVPIEPDELSSILDELESNLDLAVVNNPDLCVVSGGTDGLLALTQRLASQGIDTMTIPVTTAVHSRLLDPVLDEFRAHLDALELSAPAIPWVSNRTGTWILDEEATDPAYWVDHLRHTVRFSECVTTIAEDPDVILLEVGPGRTLSSLARSHPDLKSSQATIPTIRHHSDLIDDEAFLVTAIGRLAVNGASVPTELLSPDGSRQRVPLPAYAFQTQTFRIEPGAGAADVDADDALFPARLDDRDAWFWRPVWRSRDVAEADSGPNSWLVFLDDGSLGIRLVERLRDRGDDVVVVRCGDSFQALSADEYVIAPELGSISYESLVKELVRTGRLPDRVAHLALLSDGEESYRMGSTFFHRNQELGFQSLVFLMQAWANAGLERPLHLSVATMGSQSTGPSDLPPWPEQSTVLGPVGVIPREFADVTVSTFDLDPADFAVGSVWQRGAGRLANTLTKLATRLDGSAPLPDDIQGSAQQLLDNVLSEVTAPPTNEIVALRGGRRLVHDVQRVDIGHADIGHADIGRVDSKPQRALPDGAVVVITGGLGGIGLTIAESLHDLVGARIALMSRTGLPPRDQWPELLERLGRQHPTAIRLSAVNALEERGADVLLVEGDVTDVSQVNVALGEVRDRFGSIDGVVHAAGVIDDSLIVAKPTTEMEDVLAPKVYGTLVLEGATSTDDLALFAVFGSTSSETTPTGQVDYVAANAFVNSFVAARRAAGDDHVVALNWGVWNEVGMAAELAASANPDPDRVEPVVVSATHPLFDDVRTDARGTVRIRCTWSATDSWVLDEHRTAAGDALAPGSVYPELARAALAEIGFERPFEIRDLTFLRPLAPGADGILHVEIVLEPTNEGYTFVVRERIDSTRTTAEGAPGATDVAYRRCGEASLLLHRIDDPEPRDIQAELGSCPTRGAVRTTQHDYLRFGPRWDIVERVNIGNGRAVATLRLPDAFVGDLGHVGLHPAQVDLGTGFAMALIDGYTGDRLWVPVSYQRIVVHDRLPQTAFAIAEARPGSSEQRGFATFDVTLCALDGSILVEATGFTIKRLDTPLDVGANRSVLATDLERDKSQAPAPASSSALAFQHNFSLGLTADEGKRAFERSLSWSRDPVLFVTPIDLTDLRRQSELLAQTQFGDASPDVSAVFDRPTLSSDYLAPRNDVEEELVTVWQELLGVSKVGVNDSFFDLGGHSLIAVRLFARVKTLFSVDFPISILFEAPTIAQCAELISAAMPAGSDEHAESTVATAQPRFRHLVPMHPGEGGPETPFFLVAGMFGNVLNLRHLAHQIGTDRPFYGVQARGLYGDEEPHEDFVDMATDYVAEVRSVQPHGPYLLGGFSGGGIIALEMARLLKDDGEEVELLVMLDTPITLNPSLTTAEKIKMHTTQMRREGIGYVVKWAKNRLDWERKTRYRRRHGVEAPADTGALHSTEIEAAFNRAIQNYEVRHYPGTITLYRPKLTPLHVFSPDRQIDPWRRFVYHDNGWGPYCEAVEVTEVPGSHDGMVLEPAVRVLSGNIRDRLDRID